MLGARLSSRAKRTAGRLACRGDALHAAAIDWPNLFEEKAGGARSDRLAAAAALDYMRAGDYLTVSKLDHLVRSSTKDLPRYLVSIDEVEARSRLDFLAGLWDGVEPAVECHVQSHLWDDHEGALCRAIQ